MARSTSKGRSSTPRRRRVWNRQPFNLIGITTALPQAVDLLSGLKALGTGQSPLGWTVGPIKLSGVMVRRTSATVAANDSIVLGAVVQSSQNEALDMDPAQVPMIDWMLWQAFPTPDTTATALYQSGWGPDEHPGTGSMRRVDELQENLWLVGGATTAGATFTVSGWASVLVILP